MRKKRILVKLVCLQALVYACQASPSPEPSLNTSESLGPEGQGNAQAVDSHGSTGANTSDQELHADENISLPIVQVIEPNDAVVGSWVKVEDDQSELFSAQGPRDSDLLQGDIGDCTLYAVLGSLASVNPARIANMVRLVGRTTAGVKVYAVALNNPYTNSIQTINVDATFLKAQEKNTLFLFDRFSQDENNQHMILWPNIIQKAVAVYYGSYRSIAKSAQANMYLTSGQVAVTNFAASVSQEQAKQGLMAASGHGYLITADSDLNFENRPNDASSTPVSSSGGINCATVQGVSYCLADDHEYEVESFDGNNVRVRNPWGYNLSNTDAVRGVFSLPVEAYFALTMYTNISVGTVR